MLFSNHFRSLFFSSWYLFDCTKVELFVMSLCMLGWWNKAGLLRLNRGLFLQACLYQTSLR